MRPAIEFVEPRSMGDRTWGVELLVAETSQYLGKVLYMEKGTSGGLQYHVEKDETFHLFAGEAIVRFERDGKLEEVRMQPGESYHIPPGAVHQVEAVKACVFFEASTPHYDDRVRVEQEFGISDDSGLPTTKAV